MQDLISKYKFILLPGMDGTGKLFKPFIEQFTNPDDIRIISYPTDRYIPLDELVNFVTSQLPKNKPLIILGESFSGPVAISLASKSDLDIYGIILVATFAKYPLSIFKLFSRFIPLSLLFRLPIPDFLIRRYCFANFSTELLNETLRDSIKSNLPRVLAQRAHEGARVNVSNLLTEIKIPCLLISACNDKLVPDGAMQYLNTRLPDTRWVKIDGPHFILQTQPKACLDAIKQWLVNDFEN